MKSFMRMMLTGGLVMFLSAFSCGQNGPTPATVGVAFVQAAGTATSGPVVANCVYVGTATGKYTMPGTCSTGPVTSFTVSTVRGTPVFIAVTAQFQSAGKLTEGPFSNEVTATSPVLNAPTNVTTPTISMNEMPKGFAKADTVGSLHITNTK